MAFTPINWIASYFGWTEFTPVIPKMYWDVYSGEERIKKICFEINKLCEYANMLADNINIDHTLIKELQDAIGNIENIDELQEQVEALQNSADAIEELLSGLPGYAEFESMSVELVKKQYTFDTVSAMCAYEHFSIGDICETLGFYSANDGGGALYIISNGESHNDIDTFDCNGVIATLITHKTRNVLQYGIRDDDDFTERMQYISSILQEEDVLYFPAGDYYPRETIIVTTSGVTIKGDGKYATWLRGNKLDSNSTCVLRIGGEGYTSTQHSVQIQDLCALGRTGNKNGIEVCMYYNFFIDNCMLYGNYPYSLTVTGGGLVINRVHSLCKVTNTFFPTSGGNGLVTIAPEGFAQAVSLLHVENCTFMETNIGACILGGGTAKFTDCKFYQCGEDGFAIYTGSSIEAKTVDGLIVTDCHFTGNGTETCAIGVGGIGTGNVIDIYDNVFQNYKCGIYLQNCVRFNGSIVDNTFILCAQTNEAQDVAIATQAIATNEYLAEIIISGLSSVGYMRKITGNVIGRSGANHKLLILSVNGSALNACLIDNMMSGTYYINGTTYQGTDGIRYGTQF